MGDTLPFKQRGSRRNYYLAIKDAIGGTNDATIRDSPLSGTFNCCPLERRHEDIALLDITEPDAAVIRRFDAMDR